MNKHPEEKTVLTLALLSILVPPASWFSFFMARRVLRESKARNFDTSTPNLSLVISATVMGLQVIALILGAILAVSIYHAFYRY